MRNNKKNKKRNRRKKRIYKKKIIFLLIASIIFICGFIVFFSYQHNEKKKQITRNNLEKEIASHYNDLVKTVKDATLYKLKNNRYEEVGLVGKEQELAMEKVTITYQTKYLVVSTFSESYYIYYKDIEPIKEVKEKTDSMTRYKKYIPFNLNIITKDVTSFYDEKDNLIYQFNTSFNLPIIIKKDNIYGVEYNDRLLYVKDKDIDKIIENKNTNQENTKGIAVLNYHFFYDETKASERKDCNQSICLSKSKFINHLEYLKEKNIFTPTLTELELYIDSNIQLPKSVVITIDDGWRTEIATKLLEDYKLNGTIFLITSWFKEINFLSDLEYIDYHSHGDNLHNQGICPGGQGGAIKCLSKDKLLADLSLSRQKLANTTYFCYPFYEYNNYSISVLKEAGFTMAFGGYGEDNKYRVSPGANKYRLPRYVIGNNTSAKDIEKYIG